MSQPLPHWIVICTKGWHSSANLLKGPFPPNYVRRHGYGFTANPAEAWPFPNEAQAKNKARIVNAHMGWTKAGESHMESKQLPPPCPNGCDHTVEEHEAFDRGVKDGGAGVEWEAPTQYTLPSKESLLEAWQSGCSVGQINARK